MKFSAGLFLVIIFSVSNFTVCSQTLNEKTLSIESGIALLGPGFAIGKSNLSEAKIIIARAREALNLEPEVTDIRVEGVSSGKSSVNPQNPVQEKTTGQKPVAVSDSASIKKPQKEGGTNDLNTSLDLSLAWRLTGERQFLDHAGKYIESWAAYNLTFNPINEGKFSLLIMAYDLTEKELTASIRVKMDDFCRRLATGYLDGMETGKVEIPQTLSNNWQSHRIELATLAAYQTGDNQLISRAHQTFNKHIGVNLKPDGKTLDFLQRDALHYVNYGFEPMLIAALAAKVHGEDWYSFRSQEGSNLQNSLDWFATYAKGERTHIEFVNSMVPYDRQRAAAGNPTFSNHRWEPVTAVETFRIAAALDNRYIEVSNLLNQIARKSEDSVIMSLNSNWSAFLAFEN